MNKAKRKATNRRLKRILSRYQKARQNFLVPRAERRISYRQSYDDHTILF